MTARSGLLIGALVLALPTCRETSQSVAAELAQVGFELVSTRHYGGFGLGLWIGRRVTGTGDFFVAGRSLGNEARTSTPEAPELQAHLAAMRSGGERWAVLESTSHGLAQQRVRGTAYDVAVLTNVTSEHLEFHGTLEAYRAAKARLVEEAGDVSGHGTYRRHGAGVGAGRFTGGGKDPLNRRRRLTIGFTDRRQRHNRRHGL